MSSNPLYSIGARLVDSDGKAERKIIQLTDDDIIIGPNVDFKGTSIFRGLMQCNGGIEVNGADANISGNLIAKNTLIGWATFSRLSDGTSKVYSPNISTINTNDTTIKSITFSPALPDYIKSIAKCLLLKFTSSGGVSFAIKNAQSLIEGTETMSWGNGAVNSQAVLLVVG